MTILSKVGDGLDKARQGRAGTGSDRQGQAGTGTATLFKYSFLRAALLKNKPIVC
jgi:hypothetical protein